MISTLHFEDSLQLAAGSFNNKIITIILAAGLGKRMKSGLAKVLHPVAGIPMILYPVKVAEEISSERIIVVVGHQADRVKDVLSGRDVEIVQQVEQKGTADAVRLAMDSLKGYKGMLVVLCGDVPLITPKTISGLISAHRDRGAIMTVLTTEVEDPSGYGRIVRSSDGSILRIVEERDADNEIKKIKEIHSGTYVFDSLFLSEVLREIKSENAQREFYLTDSIETGLKKGFKVYAYKTIEREEIIGINSRNELAMANIIMRRRINNRHMLNGVTMINPDNTYVGMDVSIGQDVTIYPGATIEGNTTIGSRSVIYPNSRIVNSQIGSDVNIKDSSVIEDSRIGDGSQVGPFAHLRPGTILDKNVRIGNYVELKKAFMGEGSKANHLTYLGDAEIGSDVNIGAGTITCNYDGKKKHRTTIGDGVFVGSDVQFVAPVKIGEGAFIAAGSTVTKDVPPGSLAISRVEQKNMEGWVEKRKKRKGNKTQEK
ncbi:MAG TPA: bifunctional UDP-N-acetylglucosamine diphosphorylase/glucosamine-1-phosphate N-acetyltransferase GlmU [Nitrospiraceae bacterium]|nr:bifunctional UDP-N-acetylglucosamine diphosphorylase/glucosamine-1-phosphate N-acetyltransferase GlmU [Nitrospiraceae bacterium]